jgi:hypothetical protein
MRGKSIFEKNRHSRSQRGQLLYKADRASIKGIIRKVKTGPDEGAIKSRPFMGEWLANIFFRIKSSW